MWWGRERKRRWWKEEQEECALRGYSETFDQKKKKKGIKRWKEFKMGMRTNNTGHMQALTAMLWLRSLSVLLTVSWINVILLPLSLKLNPEIDYCNEWSVRLYRYKQ
jgi:hypothetical protein